AEVLRFGFGTPPDALGSADVFIRAWDGYDKPTSAAELAEPGAYLAFGDADVSHGGDLRWAPLGTRRIDPGPLYLVSTKPARRGPERAAEHRRVPADPPDQGLHPRPGDLSLREDAGPPRPLRRGPRCAHRLLPRDEPRQARSAPDPLRSPPLTGVGTEEWWGNEPTWVEPRIEGHPYT